MDSPKPQTLDRSPGDRSTSNIYETYKVICRICEKEVLLPDLEQHSKHCANRRRVSPLILLL